MMRTERFRRDESGMTYVFIGLSMMAFVSASMLAIALILVFYREANVVLPPD